MIDPVEPVAGILFVGFGVEHLQDANIVAQQLAEKTLEDAEVGLAALWGPTVLPRWGVKPSTLPIRCVPGVTAIIPIRPRKA